MYRFHIDNCSKTAVYKQIINEFETAIGTGELKSGDMLPSMNTLAADLSISMETVKKAYSFLRKKGLVDAQQGKGFFVADLSVKSKLSVLFLLDKLSTYKQETVNAFLDEIGEPIDNNILIFNQNIDLFEYYIDQIIGRYDYYIVSPHFPLDESVQSRAKKGLRRFPFQKLIIIDRPMPDLQGQYGAIFQDYATDAYNCLTHHAGEFTDVRRMNIITLSSSLYGHLIQSGVERFCKENGIICNCCKEQSFSIEKGDVFVMLNSQLDSGLISLVRKAKQENMEVGRDYFIISYNESPIDEVVLKGLTTISTDFANMGLEAARMIRNRQMRKMHNSFRMIRRATF